MGMCCSLSELQAKLNTTVLNGYTLVKHKYLYDPLAEVSLAKHSVHKIFSCIL